VCKEEMNVSDIDYLLDEAQEIVRMTNNARTCCTQHRERIIKMLSSENKLDNATAGKLIEILMLTDNCNG